MSHAVSLYSYCEGCGRRIEVGFELTTVFGTHREMFQQSWECPYDDCHHRPRRSFVDRVNRQLARIFGQGTKWSVRN
jgi:hypothetical protein